MDHRLVALQTACAITLCCLVLPSLLTNTLPAVHPFYAAGEASVKQPAVRRQPARSCRNTASKQNIGSKRSGNLKAQGIPKQRQKEKNIISKQTNNKHTSKIQHVASVPRKIGNLLAACFCFFFWVFAPDRNFGQI